MPVKNLQFGLAVEKVLSDIRKKDHVDSNQMKAFLASARTFLVSMLGKLFERNPICPSVVLDPNVLFNNEKDGLVKRFRIMLKSIIKLAIMPAHKAEKALKDFKAFVDLMKSSPHTFSEKSDRLDDYYFSQFNITKHEELSFVVRLVLTLSHGQATVERGFNLNKSLLKTNMTPETIISKRIIRDYMLSNNASHHRNNPVDD